MITYDKPTKNNIGNTINTKQSFKKHIPHIINRAVILLNISRSPLLEIRNYIVIISI